ncbi:MAG: DegT/DnrJ/EryC1/StrS family aminotransferase [Candidatus Tectimicrobiota bacterium]
MAHLAIGGGEPVRRQPFPQWPIWNHEEMEAVQAVVASGRWGAQQGTAVRQFETEFAAYQQAACGIAVTNGTVALKLALTAAGVGLGDEVIMPSYTFVATATAALEIGAVPVFADIDPGTYTLDAASAAACITPRTRALLPVHLGGRPADMDALQALAQRHNLVLIEDAAQAWGASWQGRGTGTLGHAAGFSFQSSKNMTAGEGGMILSNDPGIGEKARALSNCGRQPDGLWYAHYVLGGNYRLSELHGALLRVQLRRYPEQLALRQANATYLTQALSEVDGVTTLRQDPRVTANAYHVFFLQYHPEAFAGASKERFIAAMRAEGIEGIHSGYSLPVHRQPVLLAPNFGLATPPLFTGVHPNPPDYRQVSCPVTERVCEQEALWVRQNMLLGTQQDMDDIVAAISKIQRHCDEL